MTIHFINKSLLVKFAAFALITAVPAAGFAANSSSTKTSADSNDSAKPGTGTDNGVGNGGQDNGNAYAWGSGGNGKGGEGEGKDHEVSPVPETNPAIMLAVFAAAFLLVRYGSRLIRKSGTHS